jgi:small-conductance mechanosensitive channel
MDGLPCRQDTQGDRLLGGSAMDPWQDWWQDVQLWWQLWRTPPVVRQWIALAAVLAVALAVHWGLRRWRRWPLNAAGPWWAVLRAGQLPALVLLLGMMAQLVFATQDWPLRTLHRVVNLLWFALGFVCLSEGLRQFADPDRARAWVRKGLLPALAILGGLHLIGLLRVIWAWAQQPLFTLSSLELSLSGLGLAAAVLVGFWIASKGAVHFLTTVWLPRRGVEVEAGRSLARFVQFAIIVAGVLVALGSMGVDFTTLTMLGTALTVGIGFGLQTIINNLVSGLILLLEGRIKPNDYIEVSGVMGRVVEVGIRASIVRALDNSEVVIPNADLISKPVTEVTDRNRIHIPVGVGANEDLRRVRELLLGLATRHPLVLADPEPLVILSNLGESSMDLDLYCYVPGRADVLGTRNDLLLDVVDTLRREGIEMPFPQRDLHLRSGPWEKVLGQGT